MTIETKVLREYNDKLVAVDVIAGVGYSAYKVEDVLNCYFDSVPEAMKFYTTWKTFNKVKDISAKNGMYLLRDNFNLMIEQLEI